MAFEPIKKFFEPGSQALIGRYELRNYPAAVRPKSVPVAPPIPTDSLAPPPPKGGKVNINPEQETPTPKKGKVKVVEEKKE